MGLYMRRRRPIARMAVAGAVGATAYHAGKSRAEQEQSAQGPEPGGTDSASAGAAPGATDDAAEIERLAGLHASGVLTDEEFAAAKAKILGI